MKHSNKKYLRPLALFAFVVASITSGTNAFATEPVKPFVYVPLVPDTSPCLDEME